MSKGIRSTSVAVVAAALCLILAATAVAATIRGTDRRDRLVGSQRGDDISARKGDDRVLARG